MKNLKKLIKDCHRSLKTDGYLSVCVPSVKFYIESYMSGKRFRPEGDGYKPALCETGSLIDQLNYNVYMDGQHKYLFDEENLVKIVDSIETIIKTQRSVQDFMQGQLEANEFLAKRIKELETRVLMAENDKNVMNAISGLIPTTEIQDVKSTRD